MSSREWKNIRLGELVEINAQSITSNSPFDEIEYIDTSSVTNNKFEPLQKLKLSEAPSRAKRIVRAGDTIISTVRPIQRHFGFIKTANRNAIASTGFAVLTPKSIHSEFLYYYLSQDSVTNYLNGLAETTTTTFPAFRPDTLADLEVVIPSDIETQRRIAAILSALDDKIELNRQTSATLENVAQAIFKEWFVEFRYPDATGEMQESDLGMIPQGWKVVAFEDELEAERGLSYKGSGLETKDNGTPMHNLNSVYEGGGYKFEGIKYYSGEYKEKHNVKPGDLIIANTEQGHKYLLIGYPAIVPSLFGEIGIYSHHIYRVRPKPHSYLTSDFLYQLLLQPEIREQVVGFSNGTTVNMLRIEGLQKPKFGLPPRELVSQFSELAMSIRLRQEEAIKESAALAQLRDSLLPKLMSGEIEV